MHVSLEEIFENSKPSLIINTSEAKSSYNFSRMCQWPECPKENLNSMTISSSFFISEGMRKVFLVSLFPFYNNQKGYQLFLPDRLSLSLVSKYVFRRLHLKGSKIYVIFLISCQVSFILTCFQRGK